MTEINQENFKTNTPLKELFDLVPIIEIEHYLDARKGAEVLAAGF